MVVSLRQIKYIAKYAFMINALITELKSNTKYNLC